MCIREHGKIRLLIRCAAGMSCPIAQLKHNYSLHANLYIARVKLRFYKNYGHVRAMPLLCCLPTPLNSPDDLCFISKIRIAIRWLPLNKLLILQPLCCLKFWRSMWPCYTAELTIVLFAYEEISILLINNTKLDGRNWILFLKEGKTPMGPAAFLPGFPES